MRSQALDIMCYYCYHKMLMSREFTPITIEELAALPAEDFIWAEVHAANPSTGYEYSYRFHTHATGREDSPARVGISTEAREAFLQKGTESEAEEALVEIGHQTRKITGGVFDIHPFYGAVYGTKTNPVAPGFLVNLARLDESLSLGIDLSDEGYKFDEESTREAIAIGTTITIPGPMANRWMSYQHAPKSNPNQSSKDQAVANDLGERWDEEFRRFNGRKPIFWRKVMRPAIDLTPVSASQVIEGLGELSLLTDASVTWLYTRQEAEELEASFRRDN
jgi:hypothetical protein